MWTDVQTMVCVPWHQQEKEKEKEEKKKNGCVVDLPVRKLATVEEPRPGAKSLASANSLRNNQPLSSTTGQE